MRATSRASPPERDRDGGMVTIEAAIALCAFVTVVAMVLAGMSMVLDELRCTDAAREAARLVARGEQGSVADTIHRIAPSGVTYSVRQVDEGIVVDVEDPTESGLLPGVTVGSDAYAVPEPNQQPATTPQPPPAHQPPTTPQPLPVPRPPAAPQPSAGQRPVAESERRSAGSGER